MKIDKQEHIKIMLNILADISDNSGLAINLGFKGGTCCYFLYELDRFSVDLDFDLLDLKKKEFCFAEIDSILRKYGELKIEKDMLMRKLKYADKMSALKIDISDRMDINRLNKYEVKDIVAGIPLNVLRQDDIFAHKLVAVKDRFQNKRANKKIANRDLYDINFFFSQKWNFNSEIIKLRTGKDVKKYFQDLFELIDKSADNKNILEGIGALIDESKRDWVKNNLKKEVLRQLAICIKSL